MSDNTNTNTEIESFLRAHPGVEWVDAFMVDVNGLARGKRIPVADLRQIYAAGVQFSRVPATEVRKCFRY
jgi:glutamine synthetase